MTLFTRAELDAALPIVRTLVPATPTYAWPLLRERTGVDLVVKHENHTPTGSFKARGGLVFLDHLGQSGGLREGIVTATRGNHGQSVAIAASRAKLPSVIVVPQGNSSEKNASMASFGATVLTSGVDFDESRIKAAAIQRERDWVMVPSFHKNLVLGVATYAYEMLSVHNTLDAIYLPIGMGSGICAMITVRDLLGLDTEIVGVVSENAPAYQLSFDAGHVVSTQTARTFADGIACREPDPLALEIIRAGASRIVSVSDDEIADAIRCYYTDTHNLAEGAGAAGLAALIKEQSRYAGKSVGVVLTGGNIDMNLFATVLAGQTPRV